jgi:hypothetical protein
LEKEKRTETKFERYFKEVKKERSGVFVWEFNVLGEDIQEEVNMGKIRRNCISCPRLSCDCPGCRVGEFKCVNPPKTCIEEGSNV